MFRGYTGTLKSKIWDGGFAVFLCVSVYDLQQGHQKATIGDIPASMCPTGTIPMLDGLRPNTDRPSPQCLRPLDGTSRSQFVWLFGFRYTFPCLGWMRVLPLPYGQIRIINRSNFWAHFDIREQDCNRRIFENTHPRSCSALFHLTPRGTREPSV